MAATAPAQMLPDEDGEELCELLGLSTPAKTWATGSQQFRQSNIRATSVSYKRPGAYWHTCEWGCVPEMCPSAGIWMVAVLVGPS